MRLIIAAAVLTLLAGEAPPASAQAHDPGEGRAARGGGPIHGLNILSDQVEDLSSLEAIRAHLAKLPAEEDRASEIFRLSNKFRHQANPPHEFLGSDDHVHEPVKIFNVYGYCKCCCAAALLMALGRDNGMPARGWSLTHHSVSEISYGGKWHMYDLSLMNFFLTDLGDVAGVKDLLALKGLLINREHSPFIDEKGYYPARAQQLPPGGPLADYEVEGSHVYEYTYTTGHRIGVSLRQGEAMVRNWGNQGRHVNERQLDFWHPPLDKTGPVGSQVYLKDYYPGYEYGLIGNGELSYAPDLASDSWRDGLLSESNIAVGRGEGGAARLHLASPGRGEIVVPFASSYVFLGGTLRGRFSRGAGDDEIHVAISLNHGLDWERIWSAKELGASEVAIDLEPWVFRRYQYLVKVELQGDSAAGPGIESVSFSHIVQHSQRILPLLVRGPNVITVTADEPAMATRTLEGSLHSSNDLNASYTDFHPEVVGLKGEGHLFLATGASQGTLTFPVEAPGPVRRVRFGGSLRCAKEGASIRLLVSDDDGASWKVAGTMEGPFAGFTRFVTFDDLEADASRVLVRYEFNGPAPVGLFVFRIDVDYEDPAAGERPVRITYEWTERGHPRSHAQVVDRYPATYTIDVAVVPKMKSIKVEGL